jgi:hypothetical protein
MAAAAMASRTFPAGIQLHGDNLVAGFEFARAGIMNRATEFVAHNHSRRAILPRADIAATNAYFADFDDHLLTVWPRFRDFLHNYLAYAFDNNRFQYSPLLF